MLDMDVIELSSSAWRNPTVLVWKPDSSVCFCIDFREVNKIAQFDAYPMPRPDVLLSQLGATQYVSALDILKGYWQVPLSQVFHHLQTEGPKKIKLAPICLHWIALPLAVLQFAS